MAISKVKRSYTFKQPKFRVYEALYKLELAFQSLANEIEKLEDGRAIPLETINFYRTMAAQLRTTINQQMANVLPASRNGRAAPLKARSALSG